jgi:hypothetical protein
MKGMTAPVTSPLLDREEYIEQAYFFRMLRDRLANGMVTQDILAQIDQEVLSTTRLPYAIQFLTAEVKHTGLLSSGFTRLPHYFTAFQAHILRGTEDETRRFSAEAGLLVLQREAEYRAGNPTPAGLFVYEFEVMCRNRLGYDEGLVCMARDGIFDAEWGKFLDQLRRHVGLIDFADLVYLRSHLYVMDQRRQKPDYEPPVPPLFGEKEGKIARANRGRDPLFLFAALQRQLGYPEVPRVKPRDDPAALIEVLQSRIRDLEKRLLLVESEVRGQIDLSQFARPDILNEESEAES